MRLSPECVITGCTLVVENETKWVRGDLHRVGTAYVFNAAVNHEGLAAWVWSVIPESPQPVVYVDSNFYFERRGVLVFTWEAARLNIAAGAHLTAR